LFALIVFQTFVFCSWEFEPDVVVVANEIPFHVVLLQVLLLLLSLFAQLFGVLRIDDASSWSIRRLYCRIVTIGIRS